MKMKCLLGALWCSLIFGSALAQDAGKPREVVYSLDQPFEDSPQPSAKIILRFTNAGAYLSPGPLRSLTLLLGDKVVDVPSPLLDKIGPVNPAAVDFSWVGNTYTVKLKREGQEGRAAVAKLLIKDGSKPQLKFVSK